VHHHPRIVEYQRHQERVRVAAEFAEGKVNETIERELAELSVAVPS
jgi:hypothetical protein